MAKKPVTFKAVIRVRDLDGLTPSEKSVLFALASRTNFEAQAFPSRERLARDAGIKNVATVSRVTAKLEKKGLLKITKRSKKGGRTSNLYQLFPNAQGDSKSPDKDHFQSPCQSDSAQQEEYKTSKHSKVKKEECQEQDGLLAFSDPQKTKQATPAKQLIEQYAGTPATSKSMTAFWCTLMRKYHPDATRYRSELKANQPLLPCHYEPLYRLFKEATRQHHRLPFEIIGTAVSEWSALSKFAASDQYWVKAPKWPTPKWIYENPSIVYHYWAKVREMDWNTFLQKYPNKYWVHHKVK